MQYVTATDKTTATYNTYKDCYTKVLSQTSATTPKGANAEKAAAFKKKLQGFAQGGGFDIIEDFEKKYDCAGFC